MDVWLRDADGNVRHLFGDEMYAFPASWSPDGRKLLVLDFRSNTDTSIHLVDVESGESRELTPHDEETTYMPGPFLPDGSGFYLLSNEGREYSGLALFRLDGGLEWIETPEGDIEELAMSKDGSVLGWVENDQGRARVRLRDLQSGADLPEAQLPDGAISPAGSALTLSPSGPHAALIWQGPQRPTDLYVIETATGKARRLTESMLGGLRPRQLAEPELVTYPTFDGREIPAWLYRPKRRSRTPVVLSIHGGPESQERPGVHAALPVPAEPRDRRSRHQHPRLDRLRQDLSEAHPSRLGRWGRARLGSRREVAASSRTGSTATASPSGEAPTADSPSCPA